MGLRGIGWWCWCLLYLAVSNTTNFPKVDEPDATHTGFMPASFCKLEIERQGVCCFTAQEPLVLCVCPSPIDMFPREPLLPLSLSSSSVSFELVGQVCCVYTLKCMHMSRWTRNSKEQWKGLVSLFSIFPSTGTSLPWDFTWSRLCYASSVNKSETISIWTPILL